MSDTPALPYDGRCKLTDRQVRELRSLGDQLTQVELAERFSVSQAQVSLILRGRSRTGSIDIQDLITTTIAEELALGGDPKSCTSAILRVLADEGFRVVR